MKRPVIPRRLLTGHGPLQGGSGRQINWRCPAARRGLAGLLVVTLLISACATTPRYQPPPGVTISEPDRKQCEALAKAYLETAPQRSFGQVGEGLKIGAAAITGGELGILLLPFTLTLGFFGGAIAESYQRSQDRAAIYASADTSGSPWRAASITMLRSGRSGVSMASARPGPSTHVLTRSYEASRHPVLSRQGGGARHAEGLRGAERADQ